jgi:hypothetical protein
MNRSPAGIAVAMAFATITMTAADASLEELRRMTARFAPVELKVDVSKLSVSDRAALSKSIAAARVLNKIFLRQKWAGNEQLEKKLRADKSPLGQARLDYFLLNRGPWSEIDGNTAFLPGVPPAKPEGAGFYPENLTKAEFEGWVKTLSPADKERALGFFSVIVRDKAGHLQAVPYSGAYGTDLETAAQLIREAARATDNQTLRRFLETRASALLSNNYYESDVAWMDVDAPLDVTYGPYETYNDELFGYKAAFEAYVNIRDDAETARVRFFADHLQEVENNLPIDPKYRNPKLGALAPIRVVNEVYASGDGDHGVKTAAYNLPNDERVVAEKGAKRVMLKNVQEAKFEKTLKPIATVVLAADARKNLDFESFFTHIVAHEMSHGLGPQRIMVGGRATTPRQELKELYSAIEEAKADVLGLFLLDFLASKGYMKVDDGKLYTTYVASTFRSVRFGVHEAHGKAMALQFNYLGDQGAITSANGTWQPDVAKTKAAVRSLAHDLLTVEATGDYAGAKKLLDSMGVIRPELQASLDKLKDVPVDIRPIFITADQVTADQAGPGK